MNRRNGMTWVAAVLFATMSATLWAADNRIAVAVNDPSRVPALMAGMSDEQALQFARDLMAAANQLPLPADAKADRIARLAAALVNGCGYDNMGKVASAIVSAVNQEYFAKTATALASAVSSRQGRTSVAATPALAATDSAAGKTSPDAVPTVLGGIGGEPKVLTTTPKGTTPLVTVKTGVAAASNSGGSKPLPMGGDSFSVPPDNLNPDPGVPGDTSVPTAPGVPSHPTPPAPAPYYDGQ